MSMGEQTRTVWYESVTVCLAVFREIYRRGKCFVRLAGFGHALDRVAHMETCPQKGLAFFEELRHSKQLADLSLCTNNKFCVKELFKQTPSAYIRTSNETIRLIQKVKGVTASVGLVGLVKGLLSLMSEYSALETRRSERFDSGRDVKLLHELWSNLHPEKSINLDKESCLSDDWEQIGFQGRNPETDFRGMGCLGLDQLLYFTRTYQNAARQCLLNDAASGPFQQYPFAVAGINITNDLLNLFKEGLLVELLAMFPDCDTVQAFHEVYCRYFVAFNEYYMKAEENVPNKVMKFNEIRKSFYSMVQFQLRARAALSFFPPFLYGQLSYSAIDPRVTLNNTIA